MEALGGRGMKRTRELYEEISKIFVEKGVASNKFALLSELYNIAEVAEDENFVFVDPIIKALDGFVDFEGLVASRVNYLQVLRRALITSGKYNNCLRVLSEYSVFIDKELHRDEELSDLWTWVKERSLKDKR